MSATANCACPCPDPTITEVPGAPGENGEPGADGSNGVNAFTLTTTSAITLPAAAGPVTSPAIQTFADTSWMAIGQTLIISDPNGTDWGSFRVLTLPSTTSATLTWLDYPGDATGTTSLAIGSQVSPSGVQPVGPTAVADGGTGSTTATTARAALGVGGANLSAYAAGTAYVLTATPALLDFGTTDPSIVITSPGVWLLMGRARIDFNGKTTAVERTITIKLRRTNNTAADLAAATGSFITDVVTTESYTAGIIDLPPVVYTTTNSDDIIQVWGSANDISGAGTFDATQASLVAIKLYDQTV